jgi:hypothetical protein
MRSVSMLDPDHMAGAADRGDVAGAGHALEFGLDGACDLLQRERSALGVGGPESEADDGHVVDALGLDQRLADAELRRQPIGVRIHRVVEPHQRGLVRGTPTSNCTVITAMPGRDTV